MSRFAYVALLGLVAAFASACTAGVYVDENFKPFSSELPTIFAQLDANNIVAKQYVFTPPTNGSPYVSFDPYVATTTNANGTGIPNVSTRLPRGQYFVYQQLPVPGGIVYLSSPIFTHDYYTTCTDHFTAQTDEPCAPYWLQVNFSCNDWQCVNKNGDASPPVTTNSGYRVLPMIIANTSPIAFAFGPGTPAPGVIPPNW